MSRTPSPETTAAAARLDVLDGPAAIGAIVARVAERGGRIRTVATIRQLETDPVQSEIEIEVDGLTADELLDALDGLPDVQAIRRTRALGSIFGKRVIVVGGGAQVAQVALGAVSEADRHNLRGERISVDTIPLVGEANIAGIVGIAEDTNGELMLETSDATATREAFDAAGIVYEAHDADDGSDPGRMSIADIVAR